MCYISILTYENDMNGFYTLKHNYKFQTRLTISVALTYAMQFQGRIQGGLWGLETPPSKLCLF